MLIVLLIILMAAPAYSATWNVNTRAEMLAAVDAAQPGDIINVTPCATRTNWGVITILHTQDGTAGNRITITSDSSDCAVFSGQGALNLDIRAAHWTVENLTFTGQTNFGAFLSTGAAGGSLITLDGAQHVILNNIVIENISGAGVVIPIMRLNGVRENASNTIQNMTARFYTQTAGDSAFIYLYGQTLRGFNAGLTIEDSSFSDRTVTSQSRKNNWIRISDCCDALPADAGVRIRRTEFARSTTVAPRQDAIYVETGGIRITDSTFRESSGVEFRRGVSNLVSRNTIIDAGGTLADYWLRVFDGPHTIVNNLCYTSLGNLSCVELGMGNTDTSGDGKIDYTAANNILFLHNTIAGFSSSSVQMAAPAVGNNDGQTTVNPSNITMTNNAFSQELGTKVIGNDCANQFLEITNNGESGTAISGCLDEGENRMIDEPEWVSPSTGDYKLKNFSPYINAGTPIACTLESEVDHDGRIRDTTPDIGAYEFGVGDPVIPVEDGACDDLFGSAPSYRACETDDELTCTFSTLLNGSSCDGVCQSFGKVCVTSYDNATDSCVSIGEDLCSAVRIDQICVCKRNDSAPPTSTSGTRYVDTSCATPGDGTTETCGATGPWNSLQYALETADCAGMSAGDLLIVKGNSTPPSDGSWYAGEYDQPVNLSPDSACSGVIIQNASGSHVTLDGTVDISGLNWAQQGTSNVYKCTDGACGPPTGHPFTAWYDTGDGIEQRLNLVQTATDCPETLPAGWMTYNEINHRLCAHLADGSNPASASYFRIPFHAEAFPMAGEDTDNLTIRRNPDLTGGFYITRYRDNLITMDASINQNITIDGLNLSWANGKAIGMSSVNTGVANYTFTDNDISYVGAMAIEWAYDLGTGTIKHNEINNVGTYPVWEQCNDVGNGCRSSTDLYPRAIRVNNCAPPDGQPRGSIANNLMKEIGGGSIGYGIGIDMNDCTYGNTIEANLFLDSHAQTGGVRGIVFSGIPAGLYHDDNVVTNNRFENLDYAISWDTDTATSQAGRENWVLGNTCHNPYMGCWVQEDGAGIGGSFYFSNNLASIENGYTKLMDVPVSSHWAANFSTNAFECSSSDCDDQFVATIQGVDYKLMADCTGTSCLSSLSGNNFDDTMNLACGTMVIELGSNAVDRGQDFDLLPVDFLGTPRPFGSFTDIGAHEYNEESPLQNLVQRHYQFYGTFKPEAEGLIGCEDEPAEMQKNARFAVRFALSGDDPSTAQYLTNLAPYYQHCDPTCGNWTIIPTDCTSSPICVVDHPARDNDSAISQELELNGRDFNTNSRFIDADNLMPVVFQSDFQTEVEVSLGLGSIDVGDSLSIRLQYANGDTLSLYEVTPSIQVVKAKFRYEVY